MRTASQNYIMHQSMDHQKHIFHLFMIILANEDGNYTTFQLNVWMMSIWLCLLLMWKKQSCLGTSTSINVLSIPSWGPIKPLRWMTAHEAVIGKMQFAFDG